MKVSIEDQAAACMQCQFEGTTECHDNCQGGIEISRFQVATTWTLAFLIWLPIMFIWSLAVAIDWVLELFKR